MADAVYLDRDGVLNELVEDPWLGTPESPLSAGDVALAPGAVEGLRVLRRLGVPLIVASNQPAAAKGLVPRAQLDAVHARVVELLAAEGVGVDEWRYCFHKRDDGCDCRKPRTGLFGDPAAAWMIGDADTDVEAGRAAGARTILVEHPGSAHRRRAATERAATERAATERAATERAATERAAADDGTAEPDYRAADLAAAAAIVASSS